MIKTILIIIVSVSIFGLLLFVYVKNKVKKTVDPNYKPPKASGYTKKERRQIRRQGSKLVTHLQKGIDKPESVYKPKEV